MAKNLQTKIFPIVSWNCCGIRNRNPSLSQFVKDYAVEILLLQETWLRPSDSYALRNFQVYRNDRCNQRGGGTAIAVRKNIPHRRIPTPQLSSMEATIVEIGTNLGPVTLISAYKSPANTLVPDDLISLKNQGNKVIIAGDLNCKHMMWGCKTDNPAGKILLNFLHDEQHFYILPPTGPTHLINGLPHDILDMVLHTPNIFTTTPKPLDELDSDHLPIIFSTCFNSFAHQRTPPIPSNTDWTSFRRRLSTKVDSSLPLHSEAEIDHAIDHININIGSSYKRNTTKRTTSENPSNLPLDIIQLIRQRRKAQKEFYKTRLPADKAIFNKLRRQLHNRLQAYNLQTWQSFIEQAKVKGSSDMWKITKILRNKSEAISPLQPDMTRDPVYDPQLKAEIFADTLEQRFQPVSPPSTTTSPEIPPLQQDQQDHIERPISEGDPSDWSIKIPETTYLLKTCSTQKACGPDNINGKMIRNLPTNVIKLLTKIYNACVNISYFPTAWKTANIILIPKKGKNLRDPNNYRPISLLSHLGKIFEKLLLQRLTSHLEHNNIISNTQFGFRKNKSSAQQTLRLTFEIASTLNFNSSLPAVFFDLSFAFDTVNHSLLLRKTKSLTPPVFHKILYSYLLNRTFKTKFQNCSSSPRPIKAGVPQGSVLAPTLFSLFINDIPKCPGVKEFLYADDVAFTSKHWLLRIATRQVQQACTKFSDWCEGNGLILNASKCQATIFSRKRLIFDTIPKLEIQNYHIPWSAEIKYLGVQFDKNLRWHMHTRQLRQKMCQRYCSLRPIFQNSSIPHQVKILINNACIRSISLYACESWCTASKTRLLRLEALDNRIIRNSIKPPPGTSNEDIRATYKITRLGELLNHLAKTRIDKVFEEKSTLFKPYEQYRKLHEIDRSHRFFPTSIFHDTLSSNSDATDSE